MVIKQKHASGLSKQLLFAGGVASFAGFDSSRPLEEFVKAAKTDVKVKQGYEMMLEAIVKDVASLLPTVIPKEIILSGRFTRIPEFMEDMKIRLSGFFEEMNLKVEITMLESKAAVTKQAAEGAAVFANGLAGGKYKQLINTMNLMESEGTVFSNIYLGRDVAERLNAFKKL